MEISFLLGLGRVIKSGSNLVPVERSTHKIQIYGNVRGEARTVPEPRAPLRTLFAK